MMLAPSDALLTRLAQIWPEFTDELARDLEAEMHSLEPRPWLNRARNAVYVLLFGFLQTQEIDDIRLSKFAALINDAAAEGGLAEDAVSTTFLAYLHSFLGARRVWPLLSAPAKAASRR
jgi:hypothetical protein